MMELVGTQINLSYNFQNGVGGPESRKADSFSKPKKKFKKNPDFISSYYPPVTKKENNPTDPLQTSDLYHHRTTSELLMPHFF